MDEWQLTYWDWFILEFPHNPNEFNAGAKKGKMYLLPITGPYPSNNPKEVEVSPGTAFMLPIYVTLGTDHLDGTKDVKSGVDEYVDAEVMITLDGAPLLCANYSGCDSEADLADYYTSGDFDPPHFVPEFGVEYIWFEGLGVILPPLPVGEYVLHLMVENGLFDHDPDFDNTWNITIAPK